MWEKVKSALRNKVVIAVLAGALGGGLTAAGAPQWVVRGVVMGLEQLTGE